MLGYSGGTGYVEVLMGLQWGHRLCRGTDRSTVRPL